jgi:hypothetical protein
MEAKIAIQSKTSPRTAVDLARIVASNRAGASIKRERAYFHYF